MDTEPLLVFDLDGTLTDSAPDIAASVNRMLAARGLPSLAVPAVAAMVGDGVAPLMQRAFAAVGGVQDAAAAADYLRDYESNVAVETRLFAGMAAALDGLRAAGWRLAVCTNKPNTRRICCWRRLACAAISRRSAAATVSRTTNRTRSISPAPSPPPAAIRAPR